MRVSVRLHATLTGFLPKGGRDGQATVELEEGATIARIIQRLAIPGDLSRVVLVGGHDVPDDYVIHGGDVIDIFPPLAGGADGRHGSRVIDSNGAGSV